MRHHQKVRSILVVAGAAVGCLGAAVWSNGCSHPAPAPPFEGPVDAGPLGAGGASGDSGIVCQESPGDAGIRVHWGSSLSGVTESTVRGLVIDNPSTTAALDVDLKVTVSGLDGRSATRTLVDSLAVAADDSETVDVDLLALPLQCRSHSCRVVLAARYSLATGGPRVAHAEAFYAHFNSAYDEVVFYDEPTMMAEFNAGTLDGFEGSTVGRVLVGESFRDLEDVVRDEWVEEHGTTDQTGTLYNLDLINPAVGTITDWNVDPESLETSGVLVAALPGDYPTCVSWRANYRDGSALNPAAHAHAVLIRLDDPSCRASMLTPPAGNSGPCFTKLFSGYLDENGCANVRFDYVHDVGPNGPGSAQHIAWVTTRVEHSPPNKGGAKVIADINHHTTTWTQVGDEYDPTSVDRGLVRQRIGYSAVPFVEFTHETANVGGVVSRTTAVPELWEPPWRFDDFRMTLNSGKPCGLTGACAQGSFDADLGVMVFPNGTPAALAYRTVAAHEIGHLHNAQTAGPFSHKGYVPYDQGLELCTCNHVGPQTNKSHCLQSAEATTAALKEGYGHFFAALAFNHPSSTTCSFEYYKEVLLPGEEDPRNPPYEIDCFQPEQWRDNNCYASSTPANGLPYQRNGTEYDWLLYLVSLTRSGVDDLTMTELVDVQVGACGGACFTSTELDWSKWQLGVAGLTDPNKRLETLAKGNSYGVDDDRF